MHIRQRITTPMRFYGDCKGFMFKHIVMTSTEIKETFPRYDAVIANTNSLFLKNTDRSHDVWEPVDVLFVACSYFSWNQKNETWTSFGQQSIQRAPVLVKICRTYWPRSGQWKALINLSGLITPITHFFDPALQIPPPRQQTSPTLVCKAQMIFFTAQWEMQLN